MEQVEKENEKLNNHTKEKNIAGNVFFSVIKTLCTLAFPLITFSYSSHLLGVEGVGQVNFAKSIISYFTMFAMLGMNYYGTREAAKIRDKKDKLSKFVHEMLIINAITTMIAYFLLVVAVIAIPKFSEYTTLLFINSFSICLMGLGMEWLYQALEEYRYITIRVLGFQIVALILMLLTVTDKSQVNNYAIVLVLSTSGSYIFNFFHARKYIKFKKYKNYDIRKHVPSLLWLFALAVSIELYTVLDSTMLGIMKGDTSVGIYTAASKINKVIILLINSLGVVLIPRLSYYIGIGEFDKIQNLLKKSYNVVFMLSVPAGVGLFVLSKDIIYMFSGEGFHAAWLAMRIMTPIVLFIPFSVVTNQQTLMPMGKEKLILQSTFAGAITNIIGNSILIPIYAENGAAFATLISEFVVMVICYVNAKKCFNIKKIFDEYYKYWIAVIPIPFICAVMQHFIAKSLYRIILCGLFSSVSYFTVLWLLKNTTLYEVINRIKISKHRIRRTK